MDTETLVAIASAFGLGAVGKTFSEGIVKHFNGRFSEERQLNSDALMQRDSAWKRAIEVEDRCHERELRAEKRVAIEARRAEFQANRARKLHEYASRLRAILFERYHVASDDLPPWPHGVTSYLEEDPSSD